MSIEKKISTVRKAIKGTAEADAEREGLMSPEGRHFKSAFNFYRFIKLVDPKTYEFMVSTAAKLNDLKTEMGPDLSRILGNAIERITGKDENKVEQQFRQLERTRKMTQEEEEEEILKLNINFTREKDEEIKKDTELLLAFSGKEELLNQAVSYISESMIKLLTLFKGR